MRKSDSDWPEHSLVLNVVMNARAKMPSHRASLIVFSGPSAKRENGGGWVDAVCKEKNMFDIHRTRKCAAKTPNRNLKFKL